MVTLGDRKIGDGEPCFIVFEAGSTHDGLDAAKRLVSLAADAGADAVKFQIVDPDRLVADKKRLYPYEVLVDRDSGKTRTVSEPLYDILCRRVLAKDEWRELKRFADASSLAFFATAHFEDEVDFLAGLGCDTVKIASGDVNYFPLLRRAARSGMCVQLDTASASIGEIERAVDVLRAEATKRIIVHHCSSDFGGWLESVNLRVIPTLKRMYPYPVAFSDESTGWEMDVAAVALGANLIEKGITEDRMTPSIEHMTSLEPADTKRFIRVVRELETALGSTRKILRPEEYERRLSARRSVHLDEPARRGQKLRHVRVSFRRPGDGIGGDVYETLLDREFRRDFPAGHRLAFADLA
jgi:sialic acid synthase SpsE